MDRGSKTAAVEFSFHNITDCYGNTSVGRLPAHLTPPFALIDAFCRADEKKTSRRLHPDDILYAPSPHDRPVRITCWWATAMPSVVRATAFFVHQDYGIQCALDVCHAVPDTPSRPAEAYRQPPDLLRIVRRLCVVSQWLHLGKTQVTDGRLEQMPRNLLQRRASGKRARNTTNAGWSKGQSRRRHPRDDE